MEYRGEIWQGGMRVAMVEGRNYAQVSAGTAHYAMMYGQDGPVVMKIKKVAAKRKLRSRIK